MCYILAALQQSLMTVSGRIFVGFFISFVHILKSFRATCLSSEAGQIFIPSEWLLRVKMFPLRIPTKLLQFMGGNLGIQYITLGLLVKKTQSR